MTEMSKELIERARADIEEILSPAINVKAPYAKVMVDKIIERMAAFAQAESPQVNQEMLGALKEIAEDLHQCNGGKGPQLPISVKILEQAEAAISRAESPRMCECGRPFSCHLPDSGKFACPTQSMDESVPIRYFVESGASQSLKPEGEGKG